MKKQVIFLLKLGSEEILWKNLKKEVRTEIRKSWKYNLKMKEGKKYLKNFYPLYQKIMHKRGTPPHGYQFFEDIIEEFQDRANVFIAEYKDTTVAGQINIQFKDKIVNLWAASDYKYAHMKPNYFLYWEIIKWANGKFKYFDFGRSPIGSGTYVFKKHWGGKERPFSHYYSPSGRRLVSNKTQSKWLPRIWRLLPFPIANWLGPKIRKYIP